MVAAVAESVPTAVFVMLADLPLTTVTATLVTLVVAISFVTSSDSGSLVIDILTSGGHPEPPVPQKIFWAFMEGAVAGVLLYAGGLAPLQTAAIVTVLPFCAIMLLICWSLFRGLRAERSTGDPITELWAGGARAAAVRAANPLHGAGRRSDGGHARERWAFAYPEFDTVRRPQKMQADIVLRSGRQRRRSIRTLTRERYSFDLVTDPSSVPGPTRQANEETNQVNARIARIFEHGPGRRTEVGISGEWGQIYNQTTDDAGVRWAAGVHVDGHYGPWNPQLQAFHYEFDPEKPRGVSPERVQLGAFGTRFLAPAEGTVLVANVAREIPFAPGPLDNLICYNDYSVLLPEESGLADFQINTTGCLLSAGPVASYVDLITRTGAPFLGVPPEELFSPIADDDWNVRFNVNVG